LVELAFLAFLFLITIVVIKEFGNFLNTAFMPKTPIQVFNFSMIFLSAFAAYHGLEVVGRVIEFVFLPFLLTFLSIIFLVIPEMEFCHLFPPLENGIMPVLRGSFTASGFRGEVFVLLWLLPHVNRPEESKRYAFLAVLFLGIILSVDTMASLMVFGGDLTGKLTYPTFILARYIFIGEVFERVEALVMVIWVAGVIVKVGVFYTITVNSICNCFGLKGSRWLVVIPVALILYIGSLYIFQNDPELIKFLEQTWPPLAVTFQLALPAALLTVAWLRGVKGGKKVA
ncbi:MAG: endospore germination permease, partial [Clostridia bacterium]|nr:endospore germination permease [Clostridia bacterium]